MEESLDDMLEIGNDAASHGIKTATVLCFERMLIEFFSDRDADDVML